VIHATADLLLLERSGIRDHPDAPGFDLSQCNQCVSHQNGEWFSSTRASAHNLDRLTGNEAELGQSLERGITDSDIIAGNVLNSCWRAGGQFIEQHGDSSVASRPWELDFNENVSHYH